MGMTAEEKSEVDSKVKEALDFNYQTCEVELEKAEAAALEAESMEDEEISEEGEDEAIEEEAGNLQQAWEMLELAKVICTKQMESAAEDKKIELGRRICEIFLHLGEVSLENEN